MSTMIVIPTQGARPKTHKRMLGTNQAQLALNCRVDRGILEPLNAPLSVASASGAKTFFSHPTGWKTFSFIGDIVESAVVDNGGHFFVTGGPYPQQGTTTLGSTLRRLGVPAPTNPLSVQINGTASSEDVIRTSSYVYTYIVDMGTGGEQESKPSPPTGVFDVLEGQTTTLTGFYQPTEDGVAVSKYRIYRVVSGSKSSTYYFLAEINAGITSYDDTIPDDQMSTDILATTDWDMAPDDSKGIVLTPNGIYAMHRANEILLSEPFVPYAYPEKYRLSTQDEIVGLGFIESTVVVLTKDKPYLLVGSTPESMSMQPLAFNQSCVSKRSIVSTPVGVIYASPDGLCMISSSGASVISRNVYTKEQWNELSPSTIIGAYYEDRYYAFFDGTAKAIIYDFSMEDVREVSLSGAITGAYNDTLTDTLYINHGGFISAFNGSSNPLTMAWKSGEFATSTLLSPAVVRVDGEHSQSAPATLKIYAGSTLRHMVTVNDAMPLRLAPSRAENAWTLQVESTRTVYEIRISTSIEELENGV